MVQIGNILFILWKDRLQQAIQFIQCVIVVDIFYRIFYYRFVDMDLSDRSFYKFGEVYVIWSELLGVRLVIELVGLVSSARFHLYYNSRVQFIVIYNPFFLINLILNNTLITFRLSSLHKLHIPIIILIS